MSDVTAQNAIQQKISDRIRESFLDLLTKEQFDELIAAGLDDFVKGPRSKRFIITHEWIGGDYIKVEKPAAYDPAQDTNTLPGMIMAELKAMGKAKLQDILSQPEFASIWSNNQHVASQVIENMIRDNADVFVAQMFSSLMGQTMQNMRNELLRNGLNLR